MRLSGPPSRRRRLHDRTAHPSVKERNPRGARPCRPRAAGEARRCPPCPWPPPCGPRSRIPASVGGDARGVDSRRWMLHSVFHFWLHSFLLFEVFRVVHYCQTCQGCIQEVYGSPCGGLNHAHPPQGVSSSQIPRPPMATEGWQVWCPGKAETVRQTGNPAGPWHCSHGKTLALYPRCFVLATSGYFPSEYARRPGHCSHTEPSGPASLEH